MNKNAFLRFKGGGGNLSFNPASTKEFFSNFSTIFQYSTPLYPQETNPEGNFFWKPEVPFLGMDENVPLVLTGVRVTNFFIYE